MAAAVYGQHPNPDHDLYVAVYSFEPESEAELALVEGDIIRVYNKDGEWWEGTVADGRSGLFPANRVVEYAGDGSTGETYSAQSQPVAAAPMQAHAYPYPAYNVANSPAVAAPLVPLSIPVAQPAVGARMPAHNEQKQPAGAPPAKAAGGGGGGGGGADKKPRAKTSKTKFGEYARYMAYWVAGNTFIFGIAAIIWGAKDTKFGIIGAMCGVYAIVISALIVLYERYWGGNRTAEKIPVRAIIYILLSIFLYFNLATTFAAVLFPCVALANFLSAYLGEEYEEEEEKKSELQPEDIPNSREQALWDRFVDWLILKKEANQLGVLIFLLIYLAGNIAVFIANVVIWFGKNSKLPDDARLSGFAPFAKGFGNVLNLNCALIIVPVLRSIIRWLYNRSTADEGICSRSLRALLSFIPLDRNIDFHKLIAKVIVIGTIGHVVFHAFNYINSMDVTYAIFGWWPWISGGFLLVSMTFIYAGAAPKVKEGQFEIFWYSHHFFIMFFFMTLVHGAGGWGPNYWKFFLGPGVLYIIERLLRFYRARQDLILLSVTHMKPNVYSLEFAKTGVFASEYKEGQYLFLCAPYISRIQWHPFTISSAPQEKTVTVHIRKCGEGSWTNELANYVSSMGPRNATYYELTRQTATGLIAGKILGPDGQQILQADGPHSAPTQHLSEYDHVMVVGAGIGCTPVASTLKSVTQHKWRYYMGKCHPDHAYFFWVMAHHEIDSFRWLIRTIKDCQDDVYDMRAKQAKDMSQKRFEFHIYVSSVPKDQKPIDVVVDDEIGFWGVPKADDYLDKVRAPFTEADIYKVMMCPPPHTQLGDLHIYSGRPKWGERFAAVAAAHHTGDIGVMFCGNPRIAEDLQVMCMKYSSNTEKRYFKLHKENF